jgi:hypothetical protein
MPLLGCVLDLTKAWGESGERMENNQPLCTLGGIICLVACSLSLSLSLRPTDNWYPQLHISRISRPSAAAGDIMQAEYQIELLRSDGAAAVTAVEESLQQPGRCTPS